MKRNYLFFLMFALFVTSTLNAQHYDKRVKNLKSSWIGNSFGGGDNWVQNTILKASVEPDGNVYTYSTWDEGHRETGRYKGVQNPDGSWVGKVYDNASKTIIPDKVTISGNEWYIEGFNDNPTDTYDPGRIERSGTKIIKKGTSIVITDVVKATSLGIDRKNNHLMVTDDGPGKHVVRFYDNNGNFVRQLGIDGSIWPSSTGGDPSKDGIFDSEFKFWSLSGCGTDSDGRIYVIMSDEWRQSGCEIRCFSPDGSAMLWNVYSHQFTEFADMDRTMDGKEVFGMQEKYTMDYTKPTGHQYNFNAFTMNAEKYPNDFRIHNFGGTPQIRYINGHKFMFLTAMYAGLWYFKFNTATDGETAIPVAKSAGWNQESFTLNEDGSYYICSTQEITKYSPKGVDGNGEIIWNLPVKYQKPQLFTNMMASRYVGGSEDIMLIGGFTPGKEDAGWWQVGKVLACYTHWNTNPMLKWQIDLPFEHLDQGVGNRIVNRSIYVAGDYIFIDYGIYNDHKKDLDAPGVINVYKLKDGSEVGEIFPGPELFWQSSWLDLTTAVSVMQRKSGEYLILREDNWKAKVIQFEWCPDGKCYESDININLKQPDNDSFSYLGNELTLKAKATSDSMSIQKIQFLVNGNFVGETTDSIFKWTAPALGTYEIQAKAIARDTIIALSQKIIHTVTDGKPTVRISTNTNKTTIIDTITVNAMVFDLDGVVDTVKYYLRGEMVGFSTVDPYTFKITGFLEGKNTISAIAIDNDNKISLPAIDTIIATGYFNAVEPGLVAPGLQYKYYEGNFNTQPDDYTQYVLLKAGVVNNLSLTPRIKDDNFAFYYYGFFKAPANDIYTFYTTSDDGSKLYIDSDLVVNNDGAHASVEKSGNILLKEGYHQLVIKFSEQGGGQELSAAFKTSDIAKSNLPDSLLFYSAPPEGYQINTVSIMNPANSDSMIYKTSKIFYALVDTTGGKIYRIDLKIGSKIVKSSFLKDSCGFNLNATVAGKYSLYATAYDLYGNSSSDTVGFKIYSIPSDILLEKTTASDVSVFPNPSDGNNITITSKITEKTTIEIFDITGKTVLKDYMENGIYHIKNMRQKGQFIVRLSNINKISHANFLIY